MRDDLLYYYYYVESLHRQIRRQYLLHQLIITYFNFSKVDNAFYSNNIYLNGERLDKKKHSVSNSLITFGIYSCGYCNVNNTYSHHFRNLANIVFIV